MPICLYCKRKWWYANIADADINNIDISLVLFVRFSFPKNIGTSLVLFVCFSFPKSPSLGCFNYLITHECGKSTYILTCKNLGKFKDHGQLALKNASTYLFTTFTKKYPLTHNLEVWTFESGEILEGYGLEITDWGNKWYIMNEMIHNQGSCESFKLCNRTSSSTAALATINVYKRL